MSHADVESETGGLDEIVVTAEKRAEDLQKVPISMQVLSEEKLEQLGVSSFDDYAKFLPSVSFQTTGPGQAQLYFRGIASGSDGFHGGSQPATGLYLDEIPVSTIGDSLDLHIYDVQRVEALAGPQGTLYGASSLSGTLRIITNKPDASKFEAGYDLKADKFGGTGGAGGEFEGFVNIPLSDNAAIRLVGYYEHDGGYINNDFAFRTYQRAVPAYGIPADPLTIDNAAYAAKNFNDVDTYGGRAALKVDLNDRWTVTPEVVYQHQRANGVFSYDPAVGNLAVTDFEPDLHRDQWYQAALTIEGKISDWNLLYSGGWFERQIESEYDYSEYSVAYDKVGYAVAYLQGNNGQVLDPTQYSLQTDRYTKQTHELRISSPAENRFRVTAGAFYQRQTDLSTAKYIIDNAGQPLASTNLITNPALDYTGIYSVDGSPGVFYLVQEQRTDRDYALFADGTFDITEKLKLSAGIRGFISQSSQVGFFGFQSGESGEGSCFTPVVFNSNAPCENTDKHVRDAGQTHRVTLTYQIDPDAMVYGTYSTGFRPGGINRTPYLKLPDGTNQPIPPYQPDTLSNYELGWKTAWFNNRLRVNGAIFYEKWRDIQINIVGPQGIPSIFNAGDADSKGIEGDINWNVVDNFSLAFGGTFVDARLTTNFCPYILVNNQPTATSNCPADESLAPSGTRLPVTPEFKGNVTGRYKFDVAGFPSFLQGSVLHQSGSRTYLEPGADERIGDLPHLTTVDFSVGATHDNLTLELFIDNAFNERSALERNAQCTVGECYSLARIYPAKPQFFGVKFGQKF